MRFTVQAPFEPAGDQAQAIAKLSQGLRNGHKFQTLKGVTGSGKTYTMAKVIEELQTPTLIMSHNKTLAAQLYREFKDFFPDNAVEYFVSYYDYYQPEAYVPSKDLYIEKDSSINEEIDRLRLSATTSLASRRDVIVVATVSAIYGLGSPVSYLEMAQEIRKGQRLSIDELKRTLITLQYERNDAVLERGSFRVRGEVLEIWPAYMEEGFRIETEWGDVSRLRRFDCLTGNTREELEILSIFPAKHFVLPESQVKSAVERIREELDAQHANFLATGKPLEAERIKQRTEYDLEMMSEMGYCSGIENYSRQLTGRREGERPAVLLDYFPKQFLTFVDESHVSLSQIRAMYLGDRSRKQTLVDFGFRLPSALDNRPLFYEEFEGLLDRTIYVSATPGKEEASKAVQVVEQIIRPTGLLDPVIEVRPTEGQIENLYGEIRRRIASNQRVMVTTLTKKMSEELSAYFAQMGLKVRYLHSEIETFERVDILRDLRAGTIDVLVGINLLREGLDTPEVSLVAILDADKIGFLRSATSLIQTIGRAARNSDGLVLMYADRISPAMATAIEETQNRRDRQMAYNTQHGITPATIVKAVQDILHREAPTPADQHRQTVEQMKQKFNVLVPAQKKALISALEKEMLELAKNLEFESAALIRDEIQKLKK
ncbi:MAG: excinuclease ABC subunit UvrB [Spirochaetales bacterium]